MPASWYPGRPRVSPQVEELVVRFARENRSWGYAGSDADLPRAYCFFVIEHRRRRILQFNVTTHPASDWIVQQLREALPLPCPYRYVVFDRDRRSAGDVRGFLKASGMTAIRTSVRSPWQNGLAERWVGSIRRDLLDHVIPLNERHLLRLSQEYIRHYDEDRTHIGLQKETPGGRTIEKRPCAASQAVALPRIGGL